MDLCVIIPTYNEKDNIVILVKKILALDNNVRVIIVDDNSPDGTGGIVEEIRKNTSRVDVIHRSGKLGLGTAYIAGFRKALTEGADRIITMDADLSHDPIYIPGLIVLADRFDVTIGSRYVLGGGTRNWGWKRRFISWGANIFARIVLGLHANDCTAGFRCYRREVLLGIDLERFISDGYSFLIEMLFKCQQRGHSVGEVPIVFVNRALGHSKISQREIYKAMYTVMRLALRRLTSGPAAQTESR